MTYVYLDWNVLDRIEKKENLDEEQLNTFSKIEELIGLKTIICPYSNAHINDLIRGYEINPTYIPKHLETIARLTNNLCIVQYWGKDQAIWQFRDINEFFKSALEDKEDIPKSFLELCDWDDTGQWNIQLNILRLIKVPDNFKEIYRVNPIFKSLFPKTKENMTMLALCEDLYDFSNNAKKDYSLYKSLRGFVNQGKAKLKQQQKTFKEIEKSISGTPNYLNVDEALEKYLPNNKTSENPVYQRIINTYFKVDFKGYKSDDKFSNMFDDSLHTFYGAHCDYFITLDDKCHYKAAETYHQLGILTKVMKPIDFIKTFNV